MPPAAAAAAKLGRYVACWGNGQHGRLGHASAASELFPRIVAALAGERAKQVACGGAHTVAVTEDGGLWTWGLNKHGQLGHSSDLAYNGEPTEAILPGRVVAAAAGEAHTLAVSADGEVWAAGCNSDAQLGLGDGGGGSSSSSSSNGSSSSGGGTDAADKVPDFRLVRALSGRRVAAVAAGHEHSLALGDGGEVWAWGRNRYGQLGLGRAAAGGWAPTPRRVEALTGVRVTAVAAGAHFSAAVDDDGNAYLWGRGDEWQLGTGRAGNELAPRLLDNGGRGGLPAIAQVALGSGFAVAVGAHGNVLTWGTDDSGCLGQGWIWPRVTSPLPAPLPLRLAAAAAGWRHCAGADADGRLYTWGWGGAVGAGGFGGGGAIADLGAGQLGTGDDLDAHAPAQVMRLTIGGGRYRDLRQSNVGGSGGGGGLWRALGVACGRNHTAAVVEADVQADEVC